jgi:type I restriction enzyme, S subunit
MSDMNFLEKLLDGVAVEWKTLGDISLKISSGGTPQTGVAEYYGGDIPWLRTQEVNFGDIWDTGVKITKAGLNKSSANWIPKNCVIVAMYGATVGKIGINKIPMTTNQACANIQLDESFANYRYIFHFLSSQYEYIKSLGAGSQTNINAGIVRKLQIPIPCPDNPDLSLAIQAEIVRILDTFTALTAELTAELIDRKKQYNYYRDRLLTFEKGEVEWKTLGAEFPFIRNGFVGTVTPFFTDAENGVRYLQGTNIHNGVISDNATYYIAKDFHQKCSRTELKADDILMVQSGHVGESAVVGEKYKGSNCHALIVMSNGGKCNSKFVSYYFQSTDGKNKLKRITTGGTVKHILASKMKQFIIPLPPLEEQARIVALLDKFDTLTTSISEGLPREIALRQKQYEYYRDLLLTFPKSEEVEV